MISVRGLALDTIDDVQFRGASLGDIDEVLVRDATGPKLVWSRAAAMSAIIPAYAAGYGAGSPTATITSEVVEVAVTGGTGPYTYLWEGVTDDLLWTILTPTSSSTRFRVVVGAGEGVSATFKVTVTDSLGASVESDVVSLTLTNVWT